MAFCLNCGTQAEKGDVFCPKCGTRFGEQSMSTGGNPSIAHAFDVCPNCNTSISIGSKFCPKCGSMLVLKAANSISAKPTIASFFKQTGRYAILTFVLLEVIAIVGSLPLMKTFTRQVSSGGSRQYIFHGVWYYPLALGGFLLAAIILTAFYSRNKDFKTGIIYIVSVVSILALTAIGLTFTTDYYWWAN